MPLPPILARKLAKRGIITPNSKVEIQKTSTQKGYEGCPNKYNIHHECSKFCMIRWKVGVLEPTARYVKQREKLLRKYPLPINWREIYDRGCGRFYYWDMKNDIVSWLPPKHPKAKLSYSAAHLREEKSNHLEEFLEKMEERKRENKEKDLPLRKITVPRQKTYEKKLYSVNPDILDPMDPAAYSECPKGTWASGLELNSKSEKTSKTNTSSSGSRSENRKISTVSKD